MGGIRTGVKSVGVALAIVGSMILCSPSARATEPTSWIDNKIIKVSETVASQPSDLRKTCHTELRPIAIEGWPTMRDACVYGEEGHFRIARYIGSSGTHLYAVSFSFDNQYTQLRDPCTSNRGCYYSQSTDVLIVRLQMSNGIGVSFIKDFSQKIVKYTDDGVYYKVREGIDSSNLMHGSHQAPVGAITVSSSGKWAFIELISYGFVRVDLQTLQYKRVVAPGGQYGYGVDPSFELAISNDGSRVAIGGSRASIAVYEVDNDCGDYLSDSSGIYFSPYVYRCPSATIEVYGLFPGFTSAHTPRFSTDGKALMAYITNGQTGVAALLAPEGSAPSAKPLYVAYGDSFTSGEGELEDSFYLIPTNTSTNRCHISNRSYPYLLGSLWGISSTNRACSGARIDDVLTKQDVITDDTEESRPSHISIGIGGNDLDLIGKLKTCLGIGECEWTDISRRLATTNEIKALFPKIVELVNQLKETHPTSLLALVGYPSVINASTDAQCNAVIKGLLTEGERKYMDESIRYLNKVLIAAARYTKISYFNTEASFMGERLCDGQETAMNAVRFGDDIAVIPMLDSLKVFGAESFHPTPRGHQLIAAAINSVNGYGYVWSNTNCGACLFDTTILEPMGYWAAQSPDESEAPLKQLAGTFLSALEYITGSTLSFTFPEGTFAPGSRVKIEIHSSPQELAQIEVAQDGSLQGNAKIPEGINGYHTIHAIGETASGERTDIYEVIAIQESPTIVPAPIGTPGPLIVTPALEERAKMSPAHSSASSLLPSIPTSISEAAILGVTTEAVESSINTPSSVVAQTKTPSDTETESSYKNITPLDAFIAWGTVGVIGILGGIGLIVWLKRLNKL